MFRLDTNQIYPIIELTRLNSNFWLIAVQLVLYQSSKQSSVIHVTFPIHLINRTYHRQLNPCCHSNKLSIRAIRHLKMHLKSIVRQECKSKERTPCLKSLSKRQDPMMYRECQSLKAPACLKQVKAADSMARGLG